MFKNYREYIIGLIVVAIIAAASPVLAAPATTAPVTGIQPSVTSCPIGTAPLVSVPATDNTFGTVEPDELLKLPLNERLRCDPTIKTMWKTMLNLADVLVALFFLAVAFATILHINYDTYGVKKALPPLLVGIALAHFSLPIVYSIVDFAQIMSAGFYNSASSGMGAQGLADNIAAAIFSGGLSKTGGAVTAIGFGTFLTLFAFLGISSGGTLVPILFIAAIAIGLVAMAIPSILILVLSFLLYARFYIILFLTIVAPLAWLTQAWGPVQGFFKKWWSQFTMWVFMAPVVVFFLWIAIAFSKASMNGGTANFGTYVITLVMFYLAISAPFKMGGQIMGAWGGMGKKAAAIGYKGVNAAGGAGLDRAGTWKVPGGKRLADFGVKSGAAWKEGAKIRFGKVNKENRDKMIASVAYGEFRPTQPFTAAGRQAMKQRWVGPSAWEKSASYRGGIRKDVRDTYGEHGISARQLSADIESGSITNKEHIKELILMAAERGENTHDPINSYHTKFPNEDLRNDANFIRRHDVASYQRNPALVQDEAMRRQAFNSMGNRDIALGTQMYQVGNVDGASPEMQNTINALNSLRTELVAGRLAGLTINGSNLDEPNSLHVVNSELNRMTTAQGSGATVAKTIVEIGGGLDITPLRDLLNRYNDSVATTIDREGTGYAKDFYRSVKALQGTIDTNILSSIYSNVAGLTVDIP